MNRPDLRLVLLDLCGTAREPNLNALQTKDWAFLAGLAAMHRLEPLLHHRHRDCPAIPASIALRWREAHRQAAMRALVFQAELRETVALLRAAGLAPVALKGAWLAWQAYPEPAMRPLRDLDLLLPAEHVVAAFNLLLAAGYRQAAPAEMALEDCLRFDKHLPPLIAPRGSLIELHHRLWERDGRLDHRLPRATEAEVMARALTGPDGIVYPPALDMLVHLIVHALYSHRLDCGPLVLSDLASLARTCAIDWSHFWSMAEAGGWASGSRLLLALTAAYHPDAELPIEGSPPDGRMLDLARQLLLQDLDTRHSAGFAAAILKRGPARLADRMLGVNRIAGEAGVRRTKSQHGGHWSWAISRIGRTMGDLAWGEARRQSRDLAQLSRWLDRSTPRA